jgi:hypothetical protein
MKIYQFIPLAILVIAAFCAAAARIGIPMAPLVIIGAFGTFLATLQLEDGKWAEYFDRLIAGFREGMKH